MKKIWPPMGESKSLMPRITSGPRRARVPAAIKALLQGVNRGANSLRHGRGKRRVVERAGFVLMLQHPLEKIDQGFSVGGVLCRVGDEKPGETGDGIGISRRIGD